MNPTILQNGKSNQTPRTVVKRRHETFNAAMAVHGGTEKNACPAIEGMFDTLCKRSKLKQMTKLVLVMRSCKLGWHQIIALVK